MRPLVLTTMLLILLIRFSQAQDIQKKGKDVNVSTLGLKGKIKSIVRTTYLAVEKFGEAQKGDRILMTEFHTFNEKGNVIEERKEDPPGEITGKWTYEFDENGILMKDGGIGWYGIYKYDISGNCSEYTTYESDGTLRAKTKYKYDKNNNRVESNHYNSDGSLNYRITNVFDGKKNITETSNYNAAGNIDNKFFTSMTQRKQDRSEQV
ncbi:MAG: hypothetical protein IPP73_15875 [Chitinophagaceae bacterium]|nr:hypothetical protein [Chitinophagaceae bacterium]